MTRLLLVLETIENRLQGAQLELLGLIRALGLSPPADAIRLVIYGQDVQALSETIARQSGLECVALTHPQLRTPHPALLAAALRPLIEEFGPALIAWLHCLRAVQTLAALALKLQAACIPAVQEISWEADQPIFQRAVLGGKLISAVASRGHRTLFTVLPGAFAHLQPSMPAPIPGSVINHRFTGNLPEFRVTALDHADEAPQPIDTAEVVVAAGRGVGQAENLRSLEALCAIFNHAALAGSRLVCDLGWLPHSCQVGETGRRVAPKLYLACGISGARQHLVGMQQAEQVVAINNDPHAPIFAAADVGIVEDLATFVPLLLERYQAFCQRRSRLTLAGS